MLESVYEAAFAYELKKRNVVYTRQEEIEVYYEDVTLDIGFRADIIMEDKLLIEIKSIETLEKKHHKIILTYMKLRGFKLGLLINFNENLIKDGIHRKINGNLT